MRAGSDSDNTPGDDDSEPGSEPDDEFNAFFALFLLGIPVVLLIVVVFLFIYAG